MLVGVNIAQQIHELRNGVDVVVGTPGRVIDLVDRGTLKLNQVKPLSGQYSF